MNTSVKKIFPFLLLLVLILACNKFIDTVTEVEFELLEQHADKGFINQGIKTTFTVVAEEELEDYQYSITYKILKGKGYFEDVSGKPWNTGKKLILPSPLTTSLIYMGTEPGEHHIQITASDNFGFSEEIELFYSLNNVSVIWEATTEVSQIELGMSADIELVFEPTEPRTELTYEARYNFAEGAGILVPIEEDAPNIATSYKAISPDTYTLSFTPSKLGSHAVVFSLRDSNDQELVTQASFEVIEPINKPPTAQNFSVSFSENIKNNTIPLTTQINDSNGDTLTATISTPPVNGNATISGTTITYTPNVNYEGEDNIGYTVNDGNGGTATATISITVTPGNNSPIAVDDNKNVSRTDPSSSIQVLDNDNDSDGDIISIATFSEPKYGKIEQVASINGPNSAFRYTPPNPPPVIGFTDEFTYTITDGSLVSLPATVSLTLVEVPTANWDGETYVSSTSTLFRSGEVTIANGSMRFELNVNGGVDINGEEGTGDLTFTIISGGELTSSAFTLRASAPGEFSSQTTHYFEPGTYNYTIEGSFSGGNGNDGSVKAIP